MSFLFDNLTAFLVGATLLVGLLFVQQRGRQSAVETTVRYQAEVQMASFLETVSQDLENARTREQAQAALGLYDERRRADGTREGTHDLSRALSIYSNGAQTEWIEFVTLADPDAGPGSPLVAVAYHMNRTGQTATARGVARPLYQIDRWVCADPCQRPSDWRTEGGSAPAVVGFEVRTASHSAGRLIDLPPSVAVAVEAAYATPARQSGDQRETGEFGLTRQAATVRVYAAGTGGAAASERDEQHGATGIPPPPWTQRYVPPPPTPSRPGSPSPKPSPSPSPSPKKPSSPKPPVVRPAAPGLDI